MTQALVEHTPGLPRKLRRAGVPSRYLGASFDTYLPTTSKQEAGLALAKAVAEEACASEGPRAVFVLGPPGVGKTHMAVAILREALTFSVDYESDGDTDPWTYRFARWGDLEDDWCAWPRRDDVAFRELVEANLLVLDDLQVPGERAAQGLNRLIDLRYCRNAAGVTVVTANLNVKDLRDAVGERTFDRLREGARLLILDGASYRGRLGWGGTLTPGNE